MTIPCRDSDIKFKDRERHIHTEYATVRYISYRMNAFAYRSCESMTPYTKRPRIGQRMTQGGSFCLAVPCRCHSIPYTCTCLQSFLLQRSGGVSTQNSGERIVLLTPSSVNAEQLIHPFKGWLREVVDPLLRLIEGNLLIAESLLVSFNPVSARS